MPPEVFFEEIGDFANGLHVRYWTRLPTRISELRTKSEVTERLYQALVEAGISFPYPIRTIRLQGVGGANGAAGEADGTPRSSQPPKPSAAEAPRR